MKRWEYEDIAESDVDDIDAELNEMGSQGWEMCGVYVLTVDGGQIVRYVMKREGKT